MISDLSAKIVSHLNFSRLTDDKKMSKKIYTDIEFHRFFNLEI